MLPQHPIGRCIDQIDTFAPVKINTVGASAWQSVSVASAVIFESRTLAKAQRSRKGVCVCWEFGPGRFDRLNYATIVLYAPQINQGASRRDSPSRISTARPDEIEPHHAASRSAVLETLW